MDSDGQRRFTAPRSRLVVDASVGVLVAAMVAVLLRTFVLGAAYVPSGSMEGTLTAGDFVLVNKLGRSTQIVLAGVLAGIHPRVVRTPPFLRTRPGDIVLFHPPEGGPLAQWNADAFLLKRCAAIGGDTVEFHEGVIRVNGKPMVLPGTARGWSGGDTGDTGTDGRRIVVPEDHLFLIGDNRTKSIDSRVWGCVPEEHIVGRAFLIYWSLRPSVRPQERGSVIRWDRIGTVLR